MITIYIYLLSTLADWEIAPISAELNSKRFFKADAPQVVVKTVAVSKEPVKTMGGLTIVPDCTIDEIELSEKTVLLLPFFSFTASVLPSFMASREVSSTSSSSVWTM